MPKGNSSHLQKLKSLLKANIFLARFKKQMMKDKLVFLRKMKRMNKLTQKYDDRCYYGYVKEYEFSPPRTPVVQFRTKRVGKVCFRKMYSDILLFLKCLGSGVESREGDDRVGMRDLTAAIDLWADESVDERAERFIQRFYEDMRKQRQEIRF